MSKINKDCPGLWTKSLSKTRASVSPAITGTSRPEPLCYTNPLKHSHQENITRAKELLETLQYDPDIILADAEKILRLITTLDDVAKARAAALLKHRTFKAFLVSNPSSTTPASRAPSSTTLLINGNEDPSSAEGPSPFSSIAAQLLHISAPTAAPTAAAQAAAASSLTLGYFCGEHVDPLPGAPSPAEKLLSSLTGQLVSHMLRRSMDINFPPPAHKNHSLRGLCAVFLELVQQLPPGTVLVCVLDELVLYETHAARGPVGDVVRRLIRLVDGCDQIQIVFKLLVVCRGRALEVGRQFRGRTLDLDGEVEEDDSSEWYIANMGRGGM